MDTIRKKERKNWFYSYNMIFEINVSRNAKLIYMFLCRCADNDNQCFPSYDFIGRSCDIKSRTTIASALKELEAIGLIEREAQYTTEGKQTSNCYYIYDTPKETKEAESADNTANEEKEAPKSRTKKTGTAISKEEDNKKHSQAKDHEQEESKCKDNTSGGVQKMDTPLHKNWTHVCPKNGHEVLPIIKDYPIEVKTTTANPKENHVVVPSEESVNVEELKQKIDKTIGGSVNIKQLRRLTEAQGTEKIYYCIENWAGIIGTQKIHSVESFFVSAVTDGYKAMTSGGAGTTSGSNRTNFEQREYTDEYFENFFMNGGGMGQ